MNMRDRGTLVDAGLVGLGGAVLGGLIDTGPLLAGMAALGAARAVSLYWGKWRNPLGLGLGLGGAAPLPDVAEVSVVRPEDGPELAVIDPLTGLPNRRGIERLLESECARAATGDTPVGVLVFTMRDAGEVRYLYGPQAARDVLRQTGIRLQRALGNAGVVGRWAGEEFVCVLPGLRSEAVPLLAERVRRVVEAEPFRLSSGRRIAVALGAGWSASPRDGISAPFLVSRAQSRATTPAAGTRVLALS